MILDWTGLEDWTAPIPLQMFAYWSIKWGTWGRYIVGGGFANDIDAHRRFVSTALARMDCDDSDDQVALCRCISVSVFKHKIQLQAKSFVRSYRNSALSAKISWMLMLIDQKHGQTIICKWNGTLGHTQGCYNWTTPMYSLLRSQRPACLHSARRRVDHCPLPSQLNITA